MQLTRNGRQTNTRGHAPGHRGRGRNACSLFVTFSPWPHPWAWWAAHQVIAVDQDPAGRQGGVFAQSAKCNMFGGAGLVGAAIDAWTGRTARQRRKRREAAEDGAGTRFSSAAAHAARR